MKQKGLKTVRQRKVTRVLNLFRAAIPADELDDKDWNSLRVAARLVYETEDLRMLLNRKGRTDRDFAVSYWSDSIESGIEYMSWVKCLATIVQDVAYAKTRRYGKIEQLWDQHGELARSLIAPSIAPGRRLSLLVELGGVELSLLGHLWWLKPSDDADRPGLRVRKRQKKP